MPTPLSVQETSTNLIPVGPEGLVKNFLGTKESVKIQNWLQKKSALWTGPCPLVFILKLVVVHSVASTCDCDKLLIRSCPMACAVHHRRCSNSASDSAVGAHLFALMIWISALFLVDLPFHNNRIPTSFQSIKKTNDLTWLHILSYCHGEICAVAA